MCSGSLVVPINTHLPWEDHGITHTTQCVTDLRVLISEVVSAPLLYLLVLTSKLSFDGFWSIWFIIKSNTRTIVATIFLVSWVPSHLFYSCPSWKEKKTWKTEGKADELQLLTKLTTWWFIGIQSPTSRAWVWPSIYGYKQTYNMIVSYTSSILMNTILMS